MAEKDWDDEGRVSAEFEAWADVRAHEIADRRFYATIGGVTWQNDDGSDRQALLAECQPMDLLELVPEPDNPVHKQAVKVLDGRGRQLGYLTRRAAQELSNRMADGDRFAAAFCERRAAGHRPGQDHIYGAVIVIFELNAVESAKVRARESGIGAVAARR